MMVDAYNRVHNYLRISLTDNCNLRCFYCMPEEEYVFTPASQLMQVNEIEALAKIFVEQGVNKIRLTWLYQNYRLRLHLQPMAPGYMNL
jgi:cyclic pyranopterin phosphate synthase